jgi:hypothetical protein
MTGRPRFTLSVTANSLTAIPATCKNPERAMMLIEAINTNVELFNLLCYGIEGTHWNWEDKEKNLIKEEANTQFESFKKTVWDN